MLLGGEAKLRSEVLVIRFAGRARALSETHQPMHRVVSENIIAFDLG